MGRLVIQGNRSLGSIPFPWPSLPKPLLVKSASDGSRTGEMRSACGCLNWKTVYATMNVSCGDGFELHLSGKKEQLCRGLFERLDANYCVNMGETPEQWCYVSQECTFYAGFAPG